MKYTLGQIRHANLCTFKSDFQDACAMVTGNRNEFPFTKNLFHFIAEYGSDDIAMAVAEKCIEFYVNETHNTNQKAA